MCLSVLIVLFNPVLDSFSQTAFVSLATVLFPWRSYSVLLAG